MGTFFSSTLDITIAEIGNKTRLLALFLAARFAHKNVIVAGIFIAALLNHLVSAVLGVWLTSVISPEVMKWMVGSNFIAIGLWLLLPDKDGSPDSKRLKYGAFTATVVLFFLVEIGDKTQITTVLLATRYQSIPLVVIGSITDLVTASMSAVYLGEMLMRKIPAKAVRITVRVLFYPLGILTLLGDGIVLKAV